MYQGSTLLHSFTVERPVVALRFGFYGREDNSLVIVHGKGSAVTIKILRRTVSIALRPNWPEVTDYAPSVFPLIICRWTLTLWLQQCEGLPPSRTSHSMFPSKQPMVLSHYILFSSITFIGRQSCLWSRRRESVSKRWTYTEPFRRTFVNYVCPRHALMLRRLLTDRWYNAVKLF